MFFLKQFLWVDWTLVIIWIIIMIVSIVIEIETLNLVSIWFGIGALCALICGLIFAPPYLQIIIFAATSIVAIVATWPLARRITSRTIIRTNVDKHIGKIGIVTKAILPYELGEVKIENGYWRAINKEGESFDLGEHVVVDGIEGIKFLVSKTNSH